MAEEKKDKKVPRRKKHRNSKLGCATCKRRRVKCLQDLPACTNCVKHRVHCDYLDYSESQLEEFKKAKAAQAESDQQPIAPDDSPDKVLEGLSLGEERNEPRPRIPHAARPDSKPTARPDPKPTSGRTSSNSVRTGTSFGSHRSSETGSTARNGSASTYANTLETQDTDMFPAIDMESPDMGQYLAGEIIPEEFAAQYPALRRGAGVLNVLNFNANAAITQNYDNLLTGDDRQIIYPVYSISNTPGEYQSGELDEYVPPSGPFAALRDVFGLPLATMLAEPASSRALPGAVALGQTFALAQRTDVNYETVLHQVIATLGPQINRGLATLPQIRHVYHMWLGYFTYKAVRLEVMFLCLTNLTTNYLITNVFHTSRPTRFDTLVLTTQTRNSLIMHLVQHYATVIRGLRQLLNINSDPEMSASVSYILSLMAIYDPEATAHSTKCFRDGMFSVLSYTLHVLMKKGVVPPLLIPVHLQLMTNVARMVYLPAYKAAFLDEYDDMLLRLGSVLQVFSRPGVTNSETVQFVNQVFHELRHFTQETLKTWIPAINDNLDNIEYQEDILFTMLSKWAKLMPARLLVAKASTDPFEKVLNLFVRLFRKAVFAVLPQVRFFYLRDFDSPLILDVFACASDPDVYAELATPGNLCVDPQVYAQVLPELRELAAYAIRLITFFTMRISILYRSVVYTDAVRSMYPINNVVDWRNSVTSINSIRSEFQERMGLTEHLIERFNTTYILALHYPQTDNASPGASVPSPQESAVEWDTLRPYGLLAGDVLPPVSA